MNTDPKNNQPRSKGANLNYEEAALSNNNPLTPFIGRVTHGDCTQVMRQLPAASVDFVLTDPPYLVRYKDSSGRTVPNDDNGRWMFPAFSELYRVLKPDSYMVSFYGASKADRFLTVWRECGFRAVGHIVWVKSYASSVGHVAMRHEMAYLLVKGEPTAPVKPLPDVLPWRYTGNKLHPTQKPVESLAPLIQAFTKPGAVVLDPFAGSGSTGLAARKTGRRFILIEQHADYHQAASRRLAS